MQNGEGFQITQNIVDVIYVSALYETSLMDQYGTDLTCNKFDGRHSSRYSDEKQVEPSSQNFGCLGLPELLMRKL